MNVPNPKLTDSYQVIADHSEEAKAPSYLPIPERLKPKLSQYLASRYGEKGLYRHQALALERIFAGENVVLSTPTASGKSLVFYVPVIQSLLEDPTSTSIFLFPQKALSADQEKKITELIASFGWPASFLGRYDGTIRGTALRKQIIAGSRILLATPDVLHTTILRSSGDEDYQSFFQRLRYVILDECHLYDGVFGTNMALLLRRLRQVASWEKAEPQFIAASATIEDPSLHLEKLTGLPFTSISREEDGSGSGGRDYRLLRPVSEANMYEVALACVSEALDLGEKTLVFLDRRQGVETLSNFLKEALGERGEQVVPYRAGYTPQERSEIEAKLENGEVRCVISTSAMELGIDVSGLNRCILCGVPGERTSFFQRIGRVGRGQGGRGKVDIIFGGTSVDEYYFRYPELLWENRFTPCHINLNNQRLTQDHAACANYEAKQVKGRKIKKTIVGPELYSKLKEKPQERSYAYSHSFIQNKIPHLDLNLRMIGDPTYKLFVGRNRRLGELSWSQVLREAYMGAIYRHLGNRYRVEKVTPGRVQVKPTYEKSITVKPIAKTVTKRRFYDPQIQIEVEAKEAKLSVRSAWFNVTDFVLGYQETKEGETSQHLYGDKMLSKFMVTQGLELILKRPEGFYPPAARAFANALFKAAPLVANVNMKDLALDLFCWADEYHIRFLDNAEGGLELAWKLASYLPKIAEEAERMLTGCSNCGPSQGKEGCILCCRMATDSADDHLIDRLGGIELVRWLRMLLAEGKLENQAQDKQQKVLQAARENTGFVLTPGSMVFITGIYKIGEVISSEVYQHDRLYKLMVEKEERQFVGASLELIKGGLELWCLGCNTEKIPLGTATCPTCGLPLAHTQRQIENHDLELEQ